MELQELLEILQANGLTICEYRPNKVSRVGEFLNLQPEGYYPVSQGTLAKAFGLQLSEPEPQEEPELKVGMNVYSSTGATYRLETILAANRVRIALGKQKLVITRRKNGVWREISEDEGEYFSLLAL